MTKKVKKYEDLRSARWYAPDDLRSFGHRSRTMQMGYDRTDWEGRPAIAIINTWSDINPCHAHFKNRVEDVKRGILQAGGFPIELPAISLSENFVKPTTMLYRNFLAMETEELLRSHPIDACILMGGCDKTTPGLLMGAVSMDIPAIFFPAGPMLNGNWKGQPLGSGTDVWKYYDDRRAGKITEEDWREVEAGIGHQVQPDASQPMSTNGMEDMQDADMMNDTNSGAETLAPANGVDAQEERANGMAQSGNSTDWTSYSSEPLVDDSGVDAEDDHIDSNSP